MMACKNCINGKCQCDMGILREEKDGVVQETTCDCTRTPEWVSVADRLPVGDIEVLVYYGKSIGTGYYNEKYDNWTIFGVCMSHEKDPSHWMHLPEPPK